MFTSIDKAWVAFIVPVLVFVAQAGLAENTTAIDAITDPETWAVAVLSAIVVWGVPNKEKN